MHLQDLKMYSMGYGVLTQVSSKRYKVKINRALQQNATYVLGLYPGTYL